MARVELMDNIFEPFIHWEEISRRTPQEEGFDGSDRIPEGIGDAFCYEIQGLAHSITFGQGYYPSMPISPYQAFRIVLQEQRAPEEGYTNPLAYAEGFAFLREGRLDLYRGKDGRPLDEVRMETQNLGVGRLPQGWGAREEFTEMGKNMMLDLFDRADWLTSLPGLADNDRVDLATLLSGVKASFEEGSLVPYDKPGA